MNKTDVKQQPRAYPRNVRYGLTESGITAGISFDYASAANIGAPPLRELSFYVSQRVDENVKLDGYVFKG